jgi:hypothetical protein
LTRFNVTRIADLKMTRIVDIGRALHSRIKVFFDAPLDAHASPLEILQAVLEQIELKIQPAGRGRRVFPYNHILVRIGPTDADRTALQAVFDGLSVRVRERLAELQCAGPSDLDVRVTFLKRAPEDWPEGRLFAVDYRHDTIAVAETREEPPRQRAVRLTVVKGAAASESYVFCQPAIAIGRTAEPVDGAGRVRRNDVAFLDAVDGITETVGRAHARLEFDVRGRHYRLYNDSSSNPTFIVRDGSTLQVAPRDPRGVRVQSGDDIQLGRAVLRLVYEEEAVATMAELSSVKY